MSSYLISTICNQNISCCSIQKHNTLTVASRHVIHEAVTSERKLHVLLLLLLLLE